MGEIRVLADQGDFDGATTLAIKTYGQEVFAFLVSWHRAEDQAADVFSDACENLWRSMSTFEWRCSIRTWFYRLARNAAVRHGQRPSNQAARRTPMSQISEVVNSVRSRTLDYLRTEVKDEFTKLREKLSPEEQTLLVLRVDRKLAWDDIARIIVADVAQDASEDDLKRASAKVRQRFQALKTRLRTLAEEHGLISNDE